MNRYRFDAFVLSRRRRVLLRDGREQPLIPRYFDLLVYLIERRGEAVHRRDIFDHIWNDVIVSDSALTQAVRTIRRVLGDDPREPRFLRTVSRHGYQFVFDGLVEEPDDLPVPVVVSAPTPTSVAEPRLEAVADAFEPLLERLASAEVRDEDAREAAELLHVMGTAEALARLGTRPGHARARAWLRDSRWDVAEAGDVPIAGQPAALATSLTLVALRLRRAATVAAGRWLGAAFGAGLAGGVAGTLGGLVLVVAPGSTATLPVVSVLAFLGAACGAVAGAGVGAGLVAAEAVFQSRRPLALTAGASLGGALVGLLTQGLARASLSTLVGVSQPVGGGIEGLVIGGAAGLAWALATAGVHDGVAAPRGGRRLRTAMAVGVACGAAALGLALLGRPLVGGTIHRLAQAATGAQATLTPLARLLGEPEFGPVTAALVATGEGLLFGLGLALGFTISRRSHDSLTPR